MAMSSQVTKRILIIEDDQLLARIYSEKFSAEEFEVRTAFDGEGGWEMFKSFEPHLVLLDLMLPNMSGLNLLRMMRNRAEGENLPIIVFSSAFLHSMLSEAQRLGATRCFSKATFTPNQVMRAIHEILDEFPTKRKLDADSLEAKLFEQSELLQLRKNLLRGLPQILGDLRVALFELNRASLEEDRLALLKDLYAQLHTLIGSTSIAGLSQISELADALQALLSDLFIQPRQLNPSSIRTITLAIDALGTLFDRAELPESRTESALDQARVLVVDDDALSRRAVVLAMETVGISPVVVSDGRQALEILEKSNFELILLDVLMPVMSGFDLCSRIRAMDPHRNTPIVFVTARTNFKARASGILAGGNDLLAKPFLSLELGVRALVHILRGRLAKNSPASPVEASGHQAGTTAGDPESPFIRLSS